MPPIDPTPLGDEMVHRLPERKFPQTEPGEPAEPGPGFGHGRPAQAEAKPQPDMAHRPALPEHPQSTAADVEDEEADPVVDSGPGIADGVHRLGRQRD